MCIPSEAEIHRTYISGVERGVRNITVTVLAKIASALKVLPHQLVEPLPKTREPPARDKTTPARKIAGAGPEAAKGRSSLRKRP